MRRMTEFFIENYKLTTIITFFFVVGGYMTVTSLKSESYPQVNLATATVTTNYSGANPDSIETLITKPLEDEIKTVSGLKDVRSTSQTGKSTIVIRVDMDNEDVEEVMLDLEKAVENVNDLPSDLRDDPVFFEVKSEEFPVMELAITGPNINRARDLFADALKEELEDNKKVLSVRPFAYGEREFYVRLSPEKLKQYHIGVPEVLRAVSQKNQEIGGGDLRGEKRKLVRIDEKIRNAEDLQNFVVRSNFDGQMVRLKDVAEVVDGRSDIRQTARLDGKEATILTVTKKGGADTIELVEEIEQVLARFKKTGEESGFQIAIFNNEGEKVKNKLSILGSNAFSGFIIVVIFLMIFLPGRIGIMASFSLPLAIMGMLLFMPVFEMNLNTITILSMVIALGMLVDNSVVISENFTRLRQRGLAAKEAAIKSVEQLWLPITATAFTTIAAFMPMLVTKGVMGEFIKYIPILISISLLMSLLEGFYLLPMRLTRYGGNKFKEEGTDWFDRVGQKFEGLSRFLVQRRYLTAGLYTLLVAGSFCLMILANRFVLFPAEQVEIYIARYELNQGDYLEKTDLIGKDLSLAVREVLGDDLLYVVNKTGTTNTRPGSDPKGKDGENVGLVLIYMTKEAANKYQYTEVLERLRTIQHPELSSLTFEAMVNGPPVGEPIQATFRSNSVEDLDNILNEIKTQMQDIPGVYDLVVDDVVGEEEVILEVKQEIASELGLSTADIGNIVRTAFDGNRASKVTLKNKEIDINILFGEEHQASSENLKEVLLSDTRSNLIPLTDIVNIRTINGASQIKRFDFKRAKTLTGQVKIDQITSAKANQTVNDIFQKIKNQYPSVSLVFGGEQESTNESLESLAQALVLAIILIFGILVFLFKSYVLPGIIISTIPLGLIGFSISFYLHQKVISFMALIGIIGLAGIIVNSSIVLISFIKELESEGKLSLEEILVKASGMRLRAVVVTSLTTVSGLIPTAYGIGGSDQMLIPMTLAMAWGLTSGTILTLLWVPSAYAIFEDVKNAWTRLRGEKRKKYSSDDALATKA